MRILITGGGGMLGHQLYKHLSAHYDTRVTLRQELNAYTDYGLFNNNNSYPGVDLRITAQILSVISDFHPDVVVNAAGIVKQRPDGQDNIPNIEINALLPHRLSFLCNVAGARFVHISTDCIFSGKLGHYKETDTLDPVDVYGYSKVLGEVADPHCITLRTSIIGKELLRKTGLFEWFISRKEPVKGFTKAIFSGFTTIELSRIIEMLIARHPGASGIYNVSSEPISKYDLLKLIKSKMRLKTEIIPDGEFKCDRSLDSTKFRTEFNYNPPSWEVMIEELAQDYLRRTK